MNVLNSNVSVSVTVSVVQSMHVYGDNKCIVIPCMRWRHRGISDTSVLTGCNRAHRHHDTPEQNQLWSSLSRHGSSESSPLLLRSTEIYPCLGPCCEASVNMCNTLQEQNYSTYQVGFSYQCQYFSTWTTNRLAEGGRWRRESILDNVITVWAWFTDKSEHIRSCDIFNSAPIKYVFLGPRGGTTIPTIIFD